MVPHLKEKVDQMKKVMEEMKENIRRVNPIEDLVHRMIPPLRLPSMATPYLQNSRCLLWIRTMERMTRLITLLLSRQQCTFKGFLIKLCVEPFLPPLKVWHESGSAKYPRIS